MPPHYSFLLPRLWPFTFSLVATFSCTLFIFTSSLVLPRAHISVQDKTLQWMLRNIQQNIVGPIGCCLTHEAVQTSYSMMIVCATCDLALYERSFKIALAFSRRKVNCILCVPGVQADDHCVCLCPPL